MSDVSTARRIAEALLEIGAVRISPEQPFTWASGMRAPLYCDNRLTISYPTIRRQIRDAFLATLSDHDIQPGAIVGTATAGIPHAAWLADALQLPMAYVRSRPKAHGTGSQIEGRLSEGVNVVVVEDLVSTGQSSAAVVGALRSQGCNVDAVLAIFSYELEEAQRTFDRVAVPLHTMTNFRELFTAAEERSELSAGAERTVREWRSDPRTWSEQHR